MVVDEIWGVPLPFLKYEDAKAPCLHSVVGWLLSTSC